jgi:putative ABC transport system permease protein
MLSSLWQDVRFGFRTLAKSPGFTAVAVASLALGIGLNTAVFTIVDGLLYRPLPVRSPETLAAVFTTSSEERFGTTSYPDFLDLAASNTVFTDLVGHAMMFTSFGIPGESRLALGEVVTANYFSALGITPQLGRGFVAEEDEGELAHPVAVISDRLWKQSFGGRSDVLGRTVVLKNRPYTIVGVAPATFTGLTPGIGSELWIPISMVEDVEPVGINDVVPSPSGRTRLEHRGSRWLFVAGRLRPGIGPATAQANLQAIMSGLEREFPMSNTRREAVVMPASAIRIHPIVDNALRPTGIVLLAAVGLVLLIACANLASMLLARGAARAREMAVRIAIGASRGRIIRQLTVESVMLALLGGMAGLLLAVWTTRLVAGIKSPFELPIALTFTTDLRVLTFAAVLSLATGLFFGLVPAVRASQTQLVPALKTDAPLASRRGRRVGLRHGLVVVQVAVSVVLVVGGLLLSRSLMAARDINPGFRPAGIAITTLGLDFQGYDQARGEQFYEQAVARIGALPGVDSVATAVRMPFSPNIQTLTTFVEGHPELTPQDGLPIDNTSVSGNFFETMGIPILEGRTFDSRDTPDSAPVAVVDRALAKRFWPGESAIGKHLRVQSASGPLVEIVGVSADYKIRTIGEDPRPIIHLADTQRYGAYRTIAARTAGDPDALVQAMTRELRSIEPNLVLLDAEPLGRMIDVSLFPVSMGAALIGSLAGLAMLLAGIGLYGVVAFSVSRRTREIGIRMALGADRRRVVWQVMREGLWLVGAGGLVGLGLAALASRVLTAVLHGVTSLDPVSYGLAVVALALAAVVASGIPARRAASVDPIVALRT